MKKPNLFQKLFKTSYFKAFTNKQELEEKYLGKKFKYRYSSNSSDVYTVIAIIPDIHTNWINSAFVRLRFDKPFYVLQNQELFVDLMDFFEPAESSKVDLIKDQFAKDLEELINE